MSLTYRSDIDGLRAIAVGSVVLFHGGIGPFSGGFVGVDVFFVISGFLITSIMYGEMVAGRFSLLDFYDRRIRRILPALFLVLAVMTLLASFILLPSEMTDYARSLGPSSFFYANIHFMQIRSYFAPAVDEQPLLHLWSLAIEEQFYIVFPLLLLVLVRLFRLRITVPVLLVIAVASLVVAQVELAEDPKRAFFLLSSRTWEFLVGSLLAIAPLPKVGGKLASGLGLLGLGALLAPVFLYNRFTPFPGLAAVPPVLGTALVIYAGGCAPAALAGRILSFDGFVRLGRISYSLYLWHWPLLAFATIYKGRSLTDLEAGGVILLSIVLSVLSWKYVEMPLRRPGGFLHRRAARFAGAAVLIAVTFLTARGLEEIKGRVWPLTPLGVRADTAMALVQNPKDCDQEDPAGSVIPHSGSCIMGPQAQSRKYEVLVWGDSHAGASFTGIGEAAAQMGLTTRVLRVGGCPPLIGVMTVGNEDGGTHCAAFNNAVLAEIEKARPKLVVLVGRWSMWTTLARPGLALTLAGLPGSETPSTAGSRAAMKVALERTIDAVRKTGAKVLVLGQAPEFERFPVRCVAHAEYFGGDSARCFVESREDGAKWVSLANGIIGEVTQGKEGVSTLLLLNIFCDEKTCRAGDDSVFLFRDQNHLSREGAQVLGRDSQLRAVLQGIADDNNRETRAEITP